MTSHEPHYPPRAYSAADETTTRIPGPAPTYPATSAWDPAPIGTGDDEPAPHPQPQRQPRDVGVAVGPFIAATLATAVAVGITAWLVVTVTNRIYTCGSLTYWQRNGYADTPHASTAAWVVGAVLATVIAAVLVWALTARVPGAAMFITWIGMLMSLAAAVAVGTRAGAGDQLWQTGVGNGIGIAVLGLIITIALGRTAATTTTAPQRFRA